jgi:hypothetical protein
MSDFTVCTGQMADISGYLIQIKMVAMCEGEIMY